MRRVGFELVDQDGTPLTVPVRLRLVVGDGDDLDVVELADVRAGTETLLAGDRLLRSVAVIEAGGGLLPSSAEPSGAGLRTATHVRLVVSPPDAEDAPAPMLRVTVTDDVGRPVGGATVTLVGSEVSQVSDDRGEVRLVAAGDRVTVEAELYQTRAFASVPSAVRDVVLVLDGLEPVPVDDGPPPRTPSPEGWAGGDGFSHDVSTGVGALFLPDRSVSESTTRVVVRLEEPTIAPGLVAPGVAVGGGPVRASAPARPDGVVEGADHDDVGDPSEDEAKGGSGAGMIKAWSASPEPAVRSSPGEIPPRRLLEAVPGLADLFPGAAATTADVPGLVLPGPTRALLEREQGEHRQEVFELLAATVGSVTRRAVAPRDPIRWHDPSSRREAATVARAHLVTLRQAWRADGYSFGRLLHSLPLAPGQAKRIAVVDWRREDAGTQQSTTTSRDEITAELTRDRSVSEDMSSVLTERLRGESESFSAGVGGGAGVGATGAVSGVGISGSGGVAGGIGYASARADQRSSKSLTAEMQQDVRDRTAQAAAAVRDQRTTVVRTVTQREESSAVSEVVANHNRNHAMTVLYFEVLRHLVVTTELATVTPCLLVPLPTVAFTTLSALHHQDVLRPLVPPSLRDGFDACARLIGPEDQEDRSVRQVHVSFELEAPSARVAPSDDADGEQGEGEVPQIVTGPAPYAAARVRTVGTAGSGAWVEAAVTTEAAGEDRWRYDVTTLESPGHDWDEHLTGIEVELLERDRVARGLPHVVDLEATALLAERSVALVRSRGRSPLRGNRVRAATLPAPRDRGERADAATAARLVAHLNAHRIGYHKAIWVGMDRDELFAMLDERLAPGLPRGRSLASVVRPEPVGFLGNSLVLPQVEGVNLAPSDPTPAELDARYRSEPVSQRLTLPTGGVFAEAVLGASEAAEKIDDSRFWRWDEHPLPMPTDLAPLSTDSRHQDTDLGAPALPDSLVGVQAAPGLPDPQSLAAGLAAIAQGGTFRDVTGVDRVTQNSIDALRQAVQSAQSLGEKAGENATKAFTAHTEAQTERYRAEAVQRDMATLEQARRSGLVSQPEAERIAHGILTRTSGGATGAGGSLAPGGTNPGGTSGGTPADHGGSGATTGGSGAPTPPATSPHRSPASPATRRPTHRPATTRPPAGSSSGGAGSSGSTGSTGTTGGTGGTGETGSDVAGVDQAVYVGQPLHVRARVVVKARPVGDDAPPARDIAWVDLAMQVVRSPRGVVFPLSSRVRTTVVEQWNRSLTVAPTWTSRSVLHVEQDGTRQNRMSSDISLALGFSESQSGDTAGLGGSLDWSFVQIQGSYQHAHSTAHRPQGQVHGAFEVALEFGELLLNWNPWEQVPHGRVRVPREELPSPDLPGSDHYVWTDAGTPVWI